MLINTNAWSSGEGLLIPYLLLWPPLSFLVASGYFVLRSHSSNTMLSRDLCFGAPGQFDRYVGAWLFFVKLFAALAFVPIAVVVILALALVVQGVLINWGG